MSVWNVDADDIRTAEQFEEVLLYKTPWIDSFLDLERSSKFFVIATKGFGKTFLLKAKRVIHQNKRKDIPCIPENDLLDKAAGKTIFSADQCDFFSSTVENWNTPWMSSIILAILKHHDLLSEVILSHKLNSLINNNYYTVCDFFVNIIKLNREAHFELVKECSDKLIPIFRRIHKPIAVFIDNIDEYFNKHIVPNETRSSDVGETSPNIWYYSQLGLIEAVYQLHRINHHVKIYVSIRKEAFLKLKQTDPMMQQYMGSSVDVAYSREDLREIFIKNINKEKNLVYPLVRESKPILSFLGIEETVHSLSGQKENMFDYILRHTLQRPRDFMSMGAAISNRRPSERTEKALKDVINNIASVIATQYMNEVLPHMNGMNYDVLFSHINKNVLNATDINKICNKYNNISCIDRDCKKCDKTHIFCNLYKVGLIGYVQKDLVSNVTTVPTFN